MSEERAQAFPHLYCSLQHLNTFNELLKAPLNRHCRKFLHVNLRKKSDMSQKVRDAHLHWTIHLLQRKKKVNQINSR